MNLAIEILEPAQSFTDCNHAPGRWCLRLALALRRPRRVGNEKRQWHCEHGGDCVTREGCLKTECVGEPSAGEWRKGRADGVHAVQSADYPPALPAVREVNARYLAPDGPQAVGGAYDQRQEQNQVEPRGP